TGVAPHSTFENTPSVLSLVENKQACYHCGLMHHIADGCSLLLAGVNRNMCCIGCVEAAKLIHELHACSKNKVKP
ncbi:MAG: hypothetical protein AAGJ37_15925, partial [Pseudomonadota bacterium]